MSLLARPKNPSGGAEHREALSRSLRSTWLRISAGEGFMYVAEIVGTPHVKVGFSLDPARRISDQAGRLRLMGQFPASRAAEHRFHREHGHLAVEREVYPRSLLATPASQPEAA